MGWASKFGAPPRQVNAPGARKNCFSAKPLLTTAPMKRVLPFLFAVAFAGCAAPSTETGRNKEPPLVLTLAPTPKRAAASARIGDEVRFVIPSDRGPGFAWQIMTNNPRLMRQSSKMVYTPGPAGSAGGTTTVSFIAQRPARTTLRFAYLPTDSATEQEPVDAYEIVVTIRG